MELLATNFCVAHCSRSKTETTKSFIWQLLVKSRGKRALVGLSEQLVGLVVDHYNYYVLVGGESCTTSLVVSVVVDNY